MEKRSPDLRIIILSVIAIYAIGLPLVHFLPTADTVAEKLLRMIAASAIWIADFSFVFWLISKFKGSED